MIGRGVKQRKAGFLRRSHLFTLLELLVVMALIVVVLSLTGLQVSRALEEKRFNTSVEVILDKLRLAQELMLILKTDVELFFSHKPSHAPTCSLKSEKPLPSSLLKLSNAHQELQGIRSIAFEKADSKEVEEDNFVLSFYAGGFKMSSGKLLLYGGRNSEWQRILFLPPYPMPIGKKLMSDAEWVNLNSDEAKSSDLYPKEVVKLFQEQATTPHSR